MTRPSPFVSDAARRAYLRWYRQQEARWPVPFEDRFIETPEGRTHLRLSGPENAPPLVLLPGLASTSLLWAANAAAWAHHFRVYAPDMIYDAGLSEPYVPTGKRRTLLAWLGRLFAAGIPRPFALCGMSYGGWLAAEYALAHPGDVSRLVLIAPAATVLPLRKRFLAAALAMLLCPRRLGPPYFRWLFADSLRAPGAMTIEEFLETARFQSHTFRPRLPAVPRVLTDAELAALPKTLFLMGEHDRLYDPRRAAARLLRANPKTQAFVIPGAGHDLPLLKVRDVNAAVLEFLQG